VRTSDEMATVVNKIITFEQSGAAQSVVLVSDLNDGVDFSSSNNQIKSAVPAGFNTVSIVRGQTNTDAKTELMDQLSQGGKIVNYSGHGSVTLWRGNLLTDADVQTLAGKKASPLVVTMTCLNAYFQDPHTASLGESLIKVNQGGAVSVWASSAMTDSGQQSTMDRELFRQLFGNPNITLGEAIRQAKKITTDNDIRRTWILFGDPTMTIRIQN
ncbi:MAG TPA: C25 family cysteine peptidase, partial [Blastocatellia bacterium]|nr:C25 family cysteine peptidase [Blastocatellia bacterium]